MKIIKGFSFNKDIQIILEKLIRQKQEFNNNIHIVVPDQFSSEIEEYLLAITKDKGFINIRVESFINLCNSILEDTFNKKKMLSDLEQDVLIRKIMMKKNDEFIFLKNKYKNDGIIDEIIGLINDLHASGTKIEKIIDIDDTSLSEDIIGKKKDFELIYTNYIEEIESKKLCVGNILQISKNHVKEWFDYKDKLGKKDIFYFIGFNDLSKAQMSIIKEIIRYRKDITFYFDIGFNFRDPNNTYIIVENTIQKLISIGANLEIKVEFENIKENDNGFFRYISGNLFDEYDYEIDKIDGNIEIYECTNIISELQRVCDVIKERVKNEENSYEDFVVLMGNIDDNFKLINRIFRNNSIPIFIDSDMKLATSPVYKLLVSIYKIIIYGPKLQNILELIKYGYFFNKHEFSEKIDSKDRVSRVENYIIKNGYKKYSDYENWEEYEEEGRYIYNVLKYIREFSSKKITYDEAINKFSEFVDFIKLNENIIDTYDEIKLTDIQLSEQYSQLFNKLIESIEVIKDVFSDDKNEAEIWINILINIFKDMKLGRTPSNLNEVLVGSISRTLYIKKKICFILNVNSGCFIDSKIHYNLFSEKEREELKKYDADINNNDTSIELALRCKLLNLIQRVTELIEFSYSRMSLSNEEMIKDPIIDSLRNNKLMKNKNVIKYTKFTSDVPSNVSQLVDFFVSNYGNDKNIRAFLKLIQNNSIYYQAKSLARAFERTSKRTIDTDKIDILYPENKNINISISKIEKYNSCPYAYFLNYIIKLKERERYEISNIDKGNLFHTVLENYYKNYDYNKDVSIIVSRVEKILNDYMIDYGNKYKNSFTNNYMFERMKNKIIENIYLISKKFDNNHTIHDVEHEFRCKMESIKNRNIIFEGKIDRIDIIKNDKGEAFAIYDYKSSSKTFDKNIDDGINVQLLAYADLLYKEKANENKVIYLEYTSLAPKYVDKDGKIKNINNALSISGNEYLEVIKKNTDLSSTKINEVEKDEFEKYTSDAVEKSMMSVKEILDGKIDIRPVKDVCKYCCYKDICGFDVRDREVYKLKND